MQTKEIYDPDLGHLGAILAKNEVFGHLIGLLLYIMIAGNKIFLLVVVKVLAENVSGPNLGHFDPI